ncbi:endonuclease/exonuclease/phosphatase family protein [Hyphomonas hirschiana VP5]|nr:MULTISPECIES: endonuclease/exonuclease/phosphatase family protein [Hyphomonas]KCZ93117.1 endonuclease/exonuclease/phosphatase family protein [Hyphomonas hirschiana VP5]
MFYRILVLATALLVSACQTPAPPPADQEAGPLRIAAWNTEHLTAVSGAGCFPRDEAALDLIADYITRVDADIWLLQEVDGDGALARVFGDGWTFHVEQRAGGETYPLCRGRDDGTRLRAQNTAIAVRDGITHDRLPDLAALDLTGEGRTRYGVAITLPGPVPTDIMSVHLTSGCFSGDTSVRCPALFDQADVLEAWIDQRSAAGRAVIVGGDFNRRLEAEDDPVWTGLNDGTPAGLHIAGAGTGPSCDPRYREFIDFLLLSDTALTRMVAGSFRETTYDTPARPSDHCPISLSIAR